MTLLLLVGSAHRATASISDADGSYSYAAVRSRTDGPSAASTAVSSYDPFDVVTSLSNAADPPDPPPPPPPSPMRTISSPQVMYWTERGRIKTNLFGGAGGREGAELVIKGVSWFGLDSKPCVIGGLAEMPVSAGAALLRREGFNAVRIPLAVSALISGSSDGDCMPPGLAAPALQTTIGGAGASGYVQHNPGYLGLSYLQMVARFVVRLGLTCLALPSSLAWPCLDLT